MLVAEQFGIKTLGGDAQIVVHEEGLGKPGEPRHVRHCLGALLRGHAVAFIEGVQIFARGKLARLSRDLLGAHGVQFRRQLLVLPGGQDEAGQCRDVLRIAGESVGAHGHGEQHDAANGDLVFRQIGGQARRPPRAEILARQKERRVAAIVGTQEAPHEFAPGTRRRRRYSRSSCRGPAGRAG